MAVEHMRRWRVGDVEIIRIVELYDFQDDIWVLLKDATPELTLSHDWLKPHFITPDGRMRLNFQAFLVISQGRRIMVDTCLGNGRQREYDVFSNLQGSFLEDLAAAGAPPESVDTVLCTHLHVDHVGWNTMLVDGAWIPTFPNARYLIGKAEFEYWKSEEDALEDHSKSPFHDSVRPVFEAGLVELVETDHRVCDEIALEPTLGHTPGHVSVRIRSKGEEALITGDFLHHPCQLARPDWASSADYDPDAGMATRRRVFTALSDTPVLMIGTHFAAPTAGRVVKDGDAWRLAV